MTLARGVFGSRPRRDITQKQDGSRETGTFSQVCSAYDSTETCRRLCNRIFSLGEGAFRYSTPSLITTSSFFSLHLPPIGLLLLSRFKHRGSMRANLCGDYRKSERVIFMQLPVELHQHLPTRVHQTCHDSWKFSDCFQPNPLHLLINVRSNSNTSRFTSSLR